MAYHLIFKGILDSLDKLRNNLDSTCGFDQSYNEIPLFFREPVYGELDGTHQETIIPAIVAQILFEILYGIAPIILIKDIKQGTMSRANLAGLRFSEFMLGIFIAMGPLLILQSISCYFVLEFGFKFQVHGSVFLFVFLCVLAGLCGQAFGIWMGILVKNEFSLIVSAIMVVPLIMTCSGTLWPLESHPYFLTIIYYIFPSAPIVSSLRSVVSRGVGITHLLVWPGLVNTLLWSVIFWMLSICMFRKTAK
ncbi:ABC transporter G family member 20 [Orchesella cincta]|uniref:ABC transporter G family member 20 n=1 Tax=Orchesella cincta TaxID=48709 RepID=A0A1D2NAZ7_ORCCI|nr:ABC transporter G family member 20 [Orchesella cincta]